MIINNAVRQEMQSAAAAVFKDNLILRAGCCAINNVCRNIECTGIVSYSNVRSPAFIVINKIIVYCASYVCTKLSVVSNINITVVVYCTGCCDTCVCAGIGRCYG